MDMSIFGANLKRASVKANYVPRQLAQELSVGVHTIWKYQSGKQRPTLKNVVDMSVLLHCTPDDLLEGNFYNRHNELIREYYTALQAQKDEVRKVVAKMLPYFASRLRGKGFAERLKLLRKYSSLHHEEIAAEICTSVSTYQNYESGNQTPKLETFLAICNLYETSPNFLLRDVLRPEILKDKLIFYDILPGDFIYLVNVMK